jgi:hypothetical protein
MLQLGHSRTYAFALLAVLRNSVIIFVNKKKFFTFVLNFKDVNAMNCLG